MSTQSTDSDDVQFVYEEYLNKDMVLSDCKMSSNNEETDVTRAPDFYEGPETSKIGPLRLRLFFHPAKRIFLVCFKKINNMQGEKGIDDTHMQIVAGEIEKFKTTLQSVLEELESYPSNQKPSNLENDVTKFADINKNEYWETGTVVNNKITIRPYQTEDGVYMIRILYRRKSAAWPSSIGRTMSLQLGTCWEFINCLEKLQKCVAEADEMRLDLLKEMKKKRIKLKDEEEFEEDG